MIDEIEREALSRIEAASGEAELEAVRVEYLGRKGRLKSILKGMKDLPPEERPLVGKRANEAAERINGLLAEKKRSLGRGSESSLDPTLPGFPARIGIPHPLSETARRIERIFHSLGFAVAEGPDIEDEKRNFSDLNFPPDHPARDAQDTIFLDIDLEGDNSFLLRTHTSPVQIRVMESRRPPIKVIVPGRTYRADSMDATHSPVFHQVEGLAVAERVTMSDLKGTLAYFARAFFGPGFEVRFRPSFFPFTEPSAEVDVSCVGCGGKGTTGSSTCRICKGTGWLEILGAGMVDPAVFEAVCRRRGDEIYDPDKVTGFAFGMGIERITMLKYGVSDMRLFFENDRRFLEAFL